MRVISGKYRGRRLNSPSGDAVRPTSDKVKEALFNIVQTQVDGAVIIDLFSGSGGLGVEALSRGAQKVYFCDTDRRSIALTRSNLEFCDSTDYEILQCDYADCLRRLALRGVKADLIFCDPPYKLRKGTGILKTVVESGILNHGGTVTVERAAGDTEIIFLPLEKRFSRKYGDSVVEVFDNPSKVIVPGTFDPFTDGHGYLVEKGLEQFDVVYAVIFHNEEKNMKYSLEKRLKMMEIALKKYKGRVVIDHSDGMVKDYCKERGIAYTIRGVRNPADLAYEREMAAYNLEHGNLTTLLIEAKRPDISSTKVKDIIEINGDASDYVDDGILSLLEEK